MPAAASHPRFSIGISELRYRLPEVSLSLEELERGGGLGSPAALLRSFGFATSRVFRDAGEFFGAAEDCARQVLDGAALTRDRIIALLTYSGAYPPPPMPSDGAPGPLDRFRYPVTKLHAALQLPAAALPLGLTQQGCGGVLAMAHLAARMLAAEGEPAGVLCVAGDWYGKTSPRDVLYNLSSDAACAFLVEQPAARNRIIHYHQRSQTYYWDTPRRQDELMAAYFPMAQRVLAEALTQAGMTVADVRWFVPHNVSVRSWQILEQLMGIPPQRVWLQNVARVGHTVACDHVVNLADLTASGEVQPGDRLVLFTFGFGASWSCLILEH